MKKLFLAFLAVGSMATAQAQKAGSILLYGNAGIAADRNLDNNRTGNDPETRNLAWSVSPGVGFQFNKNWTVGVSVGLTGSKYNEDNFGSPANEDFEARDIQLNVGPFVRYTMSFSKTFFGWHQFDLGYLYGNRNQDTDIPGFPTAEVIDTRNGFYASMTPGIGINVTNCLALNFNIGGIGYVGYREDGDTYTALNISERRYNAFGVTLGQQFNWGASLNFGGYKHMKGHGEPGMENRRMNAYDEDDSTEDMPKRKRRATEEDEE